MSNRSRRTMATLADTPFTYPETGATAGELPAGYRHVHRRALLGRGPDVFDVASAALVSWQMHREAGLVVDASGPASRPGAVVVLGLGCGPVRLYASCRTVYVIDEPDRKGFAYGTLRGHPESGEERFLIVRTSDNDVFIAIDAFSRPTSLLARLGGPLTTAVQELVTDRYVGTLRTIVER